MNHLKPPHLSTTAYDELKAMLKDYQTSKDKPPQAAELIMVQNLLKLVQKDQATMSASEKYQAEKRQHNLKMDSDDKDWLRDSQRLIPLTYEHSKKL